MRGRARGADPHGRRPDRRGRRGAGRRLARRGARDARPRTLRRAAPGRGRRSPWPTRSAPPRRAACACGSPSTRTSGRRTRTSERPFFPAPPATEPHVLETLGVPVKPIPGWRDLMHHKYVVRDGEAVWTGSMNWTLDSFTRQENAVVTLASPGVAARVHAQLRAAVGARGRIGASGNFDTGPVDGVRPWFCPGRGPELSHRIAKRIGAARRRVRIATPLLTAGPILGTLAEVVETSAASTSPACATPRRSTRSSASGPRTRPRAGRGRCSSAASSPSTASARRRTRPARCTTTCTRR